MYRTVRLIRIIISLIAMTVPTWALLAGYESVFVRMQILTALFAGVAVCLVFWTIVTIIYGRIYCSTVCPLGTLMDCISASSRTIRRAKPAYSYTPPSPRTKLIFLVAAIIAFLSGSAFLPTVLDPYSAYARMVEELIARPLGRAWSAVAFSISALSVAIITAIGVIAASWKHGRIICNTVCPIGTILGLGSKRSVFHIEIDPDRCINCGECEKVCKSQCNRLPQKTVDTSRCVVCFDCTSVCPNQAINYKSGRYRLDMPMMQEIGNRSTAQTSAEK